MEQQSIKRYLRPKFGMNKRQNSQIKKPILKWPPFEGRGQGQPENQKSTITWHWPHKINFSKN